MGVYSGSVLYFQILKPPQGKKKEFLKVKESFLRALVKELPRTSKRGRKRIAEREVGKSSIGGDCKARIERIAWRKLEEKLACSSSLSWSL